MSFGICILYVEDGFNINETECFSCVLRLKAYSGCDGQHGKGAKMCRNSKILF